jgi:hypothetical protein
MMPRDIAFVGPGLVLSRLQLQHIGIAEERKSEKRSIRLGVYKGSNSGKITLIIKS